MSKLLVVDDERNVRFLLRTVFESEGFEVSEAHHGAAALVRVREERPDLVVTGLMMPVMNGRQLVERLRAEPATAGIPIIVVSAGRSVEVAGADATLLKPLDLDALVETAHSLSQNSAA